MATQINDKAKAIMLFSQLANINFDYSAPAKQDLVDNFNRVKDIIAKGDNVVGKKIKELWDCNWEVVWGPALYSFINTRGVKPLTPKQKDKFHANNSMYIVKGFDKKSNRNVYVIAIAGTNSLSVYEQNVEDVNVDNTQQWDNNTDHGVIANGSMIGLNKLLGKFEYGSKSKLMDFFANEYSKNPNMEIITCGHSLGGALCPLVALKLKEWSDKITPNKEDYKIPISTYPTAGPTSGDKAFASYAESKLEACNYISVINTNDIVPMAWEHDTLIQIENVYNNNTFGNIEFPDNKDLKNFLESRIKNTQDIHYTRIAKTREQTGEQTFEQTFEGTPLIPTNDNDKIEFMDEVLYQHLDMYSHEFFNKDNKDNAFIEALKALLYSGRKELK
ncbi:MAG: hypothetical protein RLZZ292_1772 [Bacteroidota bacterium]|jgi:hypothetical protein